MLLELIGVAAFAVAQPTLDVLGKSPETFVFHGTGTAEIVVVALFWIAVPPVLLWGAGWSLGAFGPRVRRAAHAVSLGGLAALLAFQVLKRMGLPPAGVVVVGTLLTGAVALLSVPPTRRTWLRWTAVAAPIFLLIFLLLSPVAELVLPASTKIGPAAAQRSQIPVVMVVFDQLPVVSLIGADGEIDRRLYPNFARLADDATWHRRYSAAAFETRYALPALLTGRRPVRRKHNGVRDHPNNLFTLLRESHELHVFERVSGLCPPSLCPRAPRGEETTARAEVAARRGDGSGLRGVLRDSVQAWWDLTAPATIRRDIAAQFRERTAPLGRSLRVPVSWRAFLDGIRPSPRPPLHWIHVIIPHYPWRFFPSGRTYDDGDIPRVEEAALNAGEGPFLWSDPRWPIQLQRLRHLVQVQYADRLLGTLLDRLERTGLYERALLVVTADHGIGTGSGSVTERSLHEPLFPVLLVKAPEQRQGRIDETNLSAVDLLPTMADLIGVDIPWKVHGTSAQAPADRGTTASYDKPSTSERIVLTIDIETAWRRIVADAFRPDAPTDDDRLLPYRIGPRADLVGTPVDRSSIGPPSPRRAALDRPGAFDDARPSAGDLPALVFGWVTPPVDLPIAVVVNGTVAGVSPTYRSGQRDGRFSVLVPEFLFRPGPNQLELFEVDGDTLHPLRTG
jgi:hypothetical protein